MRAEATGGRKLRRTEPYGEVPELEYRYVLEDGRNGTYWEYDPTFRPPLPKDALRGDLSKQHFCWACNLPFYYYEDVEKTCRDCGARFTFAAAEQKHWYEDLGFNPHSTAVRCIECRRRRRGDRIEHDRYSAAARAAAENPNDPAALTAFARGTIEHSDHIGAAKVERALAATRRAQKIDPDAVEAIFFEGRLQEVLDRADKARERYADFLARASLLPHVADLVAEARDRTAKLDAAA